MKKQIKKAYYKMSLQYHPDKTSDPAAKPIFVAISEAYEVLYDDARRKVYDETGSIEKLAAMTQEDLVQRYREMYKPVTIEAGNEGGADAAV